MKVLFVISEVEDIIKTGGLADVGKALPLALKDLGLEVVIVMPYYQEVAEAFSLVDALPEQIMHLNGESYSYKIKHLDFHGIQTYLIDHPYFVQSSTPYADTRLASNAQKFSLFSLLSLRLSETLSFQPNIVHSNDWHTAMTPFFMRSDFMQKHNLLGDETFFANSKSVITLHNAAFQGVESLKEVSLLSYDDSKKVYTDNGHINMLKTGIMYADRVCPVSPSYAEEVKTVLGSHGVSDVINQAPEKLIGVLNGCDYSQWDPATDEFLPANYNIKNMEGKAICKSKLQVDANLPVVKSIPVIGMVCRVTRQKGFDFIMPILEQLLRHKVQVVIMGTGDETITSQLHGIRHNFPEKFAFVEAFKPQWAHLIEAGSDFFLMPSEFEPCGLNQMYSLSYGTVPIVRKVGGLADTVIDAQHESGIGFVFEEPSSLALLSTIRNALLTYQESPARMKQIIKLGMRTRFLWSDAAKEYEEVYNDALLS